jgi:hypothetical protein
MMYLRCLADDAVYEQARLTLDAAWGHEPPTTCIDPASSAPRDASGRILLAVRDEFAAYSVASEMLPQMITSGAVEEIDAAAYMAAVNPGP